MVYHGIPWQGIPVVYLGFGRGPWYTTSLAHAQFEDFFGKCKKNATMVYHKGCCINAIPIPKVRQPEREVGWGGLGAWCVLGVGGLVGGGVWSLRGFGGLGNTLRLLGDFRPCAPAQFALGSDIIAGGQSRPQPIQSRPPILCSAIIKQSALPQLRSGMPGSCTRPGTVG